MKFRSSGMAAALGLMAGIWAGSLRAQEVVYDNTANVRTIFYRFSREHGDEIELAGTARQVTEFLFQYSGDFATNAPADFRIRFYANDGDPAFSGHPSALAPRSILWESEWQRMIPGPQVVVLPVPDVIVPERFTWTVQFRGVVGNVGDSAGLVLADPPTLGKLLSDGKIGSYWDAWIRNPMGLGGPEWGLINFGFKPDDAKANFFARLTAVPAPVATPVTVLQLPSGLAVRWPSRTGKHYELEASDEFPPRSWRLRGQQAGDGGVIHFADPDEAPQRFYRVREVDQPRLERLTITQTRTAAILDWVAEPGRRYAIEYRVNPSSPWKVLERPRPAGAAARHQDPAGLVGSTREYRVWLER